MAQHEWVYLKRWLAQAWLSTIEVRLLTEIVNLALTHMLSHRLLPRLAEKKKALIVDILLWLLWLLKSRIVKCKSHDPPLISLYSASKELDFFLFVKSSCTIAL